MGNYVVKPWNLLTCVQDVDNLNKLFGDFHDGCIREVRVWTETYVNQDLTMSCPSILDTHLRIYFQRQYVNPSAIELQFDEVIGYQFTPTPDNYDSVIFSAQITLEKEVFYWREGSDWIGGKKLKWRDVSQWMGRVLRYGYLGVEMPEELASAVSREASQAYDLSFSHFESIPKVWCDFNACGLSGEADDDCYYSIDRNFSSSPCIAEGLKVFLWDYDSDENGNPSIVGCLAVCERYKGTFRIRPEKDSWFYGPKKGL